MPMRLRSEDYGRLERFSSLTVQGSHVAAVRLAWRNHVWARSILLNAEGENTWVTLGGEQECCPAFGPDGRLWFVSDGRIGCRNCSGETEQVQAVPEGFEAVSLLPVEHGLAFVCRREVRETAPEGCQWDMPLVAEELHYRADADHGFRRQYVYRLCVWDGACRTLDEGSTPYRCLACVPGRRLLVDRGGFMLVDLESGKCTPMDLPLSAAGDIRPVVSADGRYALAAVSAGDGAQVRRIWLDGEKHPEDRAEGTMACLALEAYMDRASDMPAVMCRDSEADTYLVCGCEAFRPCLYRVRAGEDRLDFERIPAEGHIMEIARMEDGSLAAICGTLAEPPRPVRIRENRTEEVFGPCNAFLREAPEIAWHEIRTMSQDGRAELTAFLLMPPENGMEKRPLLVWAHGGPSGFWAPGFSLETACACHRGYAVLLPNPRGSTGKNAGYADPEPAFDGTAPNDVLTLVDEALRRFPQLDAERMGVLGGSYGGYMAAWMAVHTKRFRAAVPIKAVTNWLFIHFKSSQAGQPVLDEYRDFEDFLVDTLRSSPVCYAGECATPVLVIHGEKDQQVPVENAHQFYTALKDACPELPVRLMLLPDCCHRYSQDRLEDFAAIQRAALDWMDQYVKG